MDQQHFIINDVAIKPGTMRTVMLPMPKLHDWTELNMPVHVIHGEEPGPVLCVVAALHGDEVNGTEIIRRLVKKKIFKKMAGTLLAAPILNIYGFLHQDRYLLDRRDLNRCFPGSEKGSLASRLADVILKELISKATHIIDLHTGSFHRTNFPQIRANVESKPVAGMAKAFNAPVILHSKERDGSLRQYANEHHIPTIVYEGGEALRFNEDAIRHGLQGVINVMKFLKMIPRQKNPTKMIHSAIAESSYWVRSPESGLVVPRVTLGKRIKTGDVLATIASPSSHHEIKLVAPTSGIIIGLNHLPIVNEGAALYHIAMFEALKLAEKQIEYIKENLDIDENLLM